MSISAPDCTLTKWGRGQLFAFSGIDGDTSFQHGLTLQSVDEGLVIRFPGLAKLTFGAVVSAQFGSDWGILQTAASSVRFAILDSCHLLVEGPADLQQLDPERCAVKTARSGEKLLVGSTGYFNAQLLHADLGDAIGARQQWTGARYAQPRRPYGGLAAKAINQMKGMVYGPEGQIAHRFTTPDRWPHREAWLWDSAFHAIGYRHLDAELAREMLSAVFDTQLPSGQIGISFSPFSTRTHRSQPPILAWAVSLVNDAGDHPEWVQALLPGLRNYLTWFENNRSFGGVFGWVEDDGTLGSVCDESGMDNTPRFAGGQMLQAVDLTCYMAQEYLAMARLDPSGNWSEKAQRLIHQIDELFWNEILGLYCDRDPETGNHTGVEAITGFLPLILGHVPANRLGALAQAANDPQRFGTKLPLPSVAKRDPGYSKDMWQGPVWINMNWMIARGFALCGAHDLAGKLRRQTLDAMARHYAGTGSIFEYYDDDDAQPPTKLPRKGRNDPEVDPARPTIHMVIHDYGWSACLAYDWIVRDTV